MKDNKVGFLSHLLGRVSPDRRPAEVEKAAAAPIYCLLVPLGPVSGQGSAEATEVEKAPPLDALGNGILRAILGAPVYDLYSARQGASLKSAEAGSILKMDDDKRIVYGIVLEPEMEDSQGDVISEEEIEKAAHYYMEHHRMMKESHDQENLLLSPVESFIAPADFVMGDQRIRKGSWVLAAHVNDPETWTKIKSGEYTGFSVGGSGIREAAS